MRNVPDPKAKDGKEAWRSVPDPGAQKENEAWKNVADPEAKSRIESLIKAPDLLREPLMGWFRDNARDLPWRHDPDPYRVWISEIMLQQTRVEAVKPYYERFLNTLPDIRSLAGCPDDTLLKLWEGLGYYSRARNLKKTAQIVCKEYHGCFPAEYDKLLKLPGIGPYTAGAVASIAFGLPVPAVDGNVCRVIARLTGWECDTKDPSVIRSVHSIAAKLVPERQSGIFNQALMELGAIVCLPNGEPVCSACPMRELCAAHEENRTSEIPVPSRRIKRKIEEKTMLLVEDGTCFLIRKRPEKGLLAGLYELPAVPGRADADAALDLIRNWGLHPLRIHELPAARHIFSHIEWHMNGFRILVEEFPDRFEAEHLFPATPAQTMEEYPFPAAYEVYVNEFQVLIGQNKYKGEEL